MDTLALLRRMLIGLAGTALGALALALAARGDVVFSMVRRFLVAAAGAALIATLHPVDATANELGANASASQPSFTLHGPAEVLRDDCQRDAEGRLWFVLPSGTRWELITSTTDPAIVNQGDGTFHPYDEFEVRAALSGIRFPLAGVGADVYLLPYPRRNALDSAAGPGIILLSPGVWPISREHQHAEFTHEVGHVVQYARMPDSDAAGWNAYRTLRGITDPTVYAASSVHADRPHEIFAEDFRALFGDAAANYSGSIENQTLAAPASVVGLSAFFLALSPTGPSVSVLDGSRVARGAVRFTRSGNRMVMLDVFDVSGRRLTSLVPVSAGSATAWSWDGRDVSGRRILGGVVFARPREPRAAAARLTLLP